MLKNHVSLTVKDKASLLEMLERGSLKSRTYKRIIALLELDKGKTYEEVSKIAHFTSLTLKKLSERYSEQGINCLYDHSRSGRPIEITEELKDKITLLACEPSPEGHSQWSLRLLADKAVELGHCDHISHTQVGNILKKKDKATFS